MLSVTVRAMGTINSSGYRAVMVKESHVGIIHEYKSCGINVHRIITMCEETENRKIFLTNTYYI